MRQCGFNDETSIGRKVAGSVFKAANLVIRGEEIENRVKNQIYERVMAVGCCAAHISDDYVDVFPIRFGMKLLHHMGRQFNPIHLDTLGC